AMLLPDVSGLTGLRTLVLDGVEVACGVAVGTSLSHLEHLQLNLAGGAEELPFALTFLSRLRTLVVNSVGNRLKLPADIGSALPQLRKLKLLSADELRELPASVTALQNLAFLGVYGCAQLEALPGDLSELKVLRMLDVKGSDGSMLPRSINEVYGLKIST
ncbi:unnamed protein product, partial [Closterium sp. Naga37s-1]